MRQACRAVQPVYVRDVTEALEAVLKDKASIGKTYGLAGPRVYTCGPSKISHTDSSLDSVAIRHAQVW